MMKVLLFSTIMENGDSVDEKTDLSRITDDEIILSYNEEKSGAKSVEISKITDKEIDQKNCNGILNAVAIINGKNLPDNNLSTSDVSEEEPEVDGENLIWKNKILTCMNGPNSTCINADDSGMESAASSWGKSVAEVKEHAFAKLEEELQHAKEKLKLRDEEVSKLSKIREDLESELEELTASLFQEAHTMVRDANLKQLAAEKSHKESLMKVEVLTAEVTALKTLVLTSTPSKPNLHLHTRSKDELTSVGVGNAFKKQHYRSPSHFELKYGREMQSSSPQDEQCSCSLQEDSLEVTNGYEVDPNAHMEFISWKDAPTFSKDDAFIKRVYKEDIDVCLNFNNRTLSMEVQNAIDTENIFIEAVDKAKSQFPRKCALMEMPRLCSYRMNIGSSDMWYYISQICRNRIIAVCNFLNYLRYIQRGLVKSSAHDMYWEIVRLRKEMALAKLGLPISTEPS